MVSPITSVWAWTTLQIDEPLPFGLPGLDITVLRTAGFFIGFIVVLLVGWLLVEPAVSRVVKGRNRNNPTLEEAITRYVRLLIILCAVFAGLSGAGFTGFVRNSALVVAAGTLALGVAGQSVIGSLVSGVALVVDPQFNVGNYIRWEDGEGEVTSITLRVTRVQTPDGGLVTIPNTTLTDESIVRPFEGDECRTVDHIAVAYDDDIETAIDVLTQITEDIDGIPDDPAPIIGIGEFGDDAVILHVQYWIDDPWRNMFDVRSSFARAVVERLDRAGVEISPASKRDLAGRIRVDNAASAPS